MKGQLERILANGDFDASPRSRAFIRFIVEETLAGRQEGLTQAAIATRVFARRSDFDPTVDPIVRIQAGRLRRSLERYYLLAGAEDPVRIELPRGSYVPVMRRASAEDVRGRRVATAPAAVADDWPSVAVGLFETSGSQPQPGFAVQFREDLTVEIGRYRDVRVVLAREPGEAERSAGNAAGFALSGHLASDRDGERVTAQLVDCRNERQVWAEEYRSGPGTSAAFFAETARIIAARVASEHGAVAQLLWVEQRKRPASEPTPYGAILRSYRFFFNRDPADFAPAVEALQRAVAAEPECALAWVQLARLYCANYAFEIATIDTPIAEAVAQAQRGTFLDASSQRARAILGFALFLKGEIAASRTEAQNALDLNPESLVYLESIAWLMALLGEWERAVELARRAMARNPHHLPIAYHALWADHLRRGQVEEAYQAALHYRDPAFFWRALMRACCLGHMGRTEEARREAAELLRYKPDFERRGRTLIGRLIRFPDLYDRIADGLARAGLTLA